MVILDFLDVGLQKIEMIIVSVMLTDQKNALKIIETLLVIYVLLLRIYRIASAPLASLTIVL